eukprot:scaffold1572_cov141-Skeletonema_menzelii.AAC.1
MSSYLRPPVFALAFNVPPQSARLMLTLFTRPSFAASSFLLLFSSPDSPIDPATSSMTAMQQIYEAFHDMIVAATKQESVQCSSRC